MTKYIGVSVYAKVGLSFIIREDIDLKDQKKLKEEVAIVLADNDWQEMEVEAVLVVGP